MPKWDGRIICSQKRQAWQTKERPERGLVSPIQLSSNQAWAWNYLVEWSSQVTHGLSGPQTPWSDPTLCFCTRRTGLVFLFCCSFWLKYFEGLFSWVNYGQQQIMALHCTLLPENTFSGNKSWFVVDFWPMVSFNYGLEFCLNLTALFNHGLFGHPTLPLPWEEHLKTKLWRKNSWLACWSVCLWFIKQTTLKTTHGLVLCGNIICIHVLVTF